MTCIVAVAKEGRVYMGSDAMASDRWRKFRGRSPKMARVGDDLLVGWSGSIRMAQILAHEVTAPKLLPTEDVHKYLIKDFIPVVRGALKSGGVQEVKDGVESAPGSFLVACRGRVFVVESDYQVYDEDMDFASVGSGEAFARGSLHATRDNPDPQARVRMALEAASDLCATVAPPFFFETLGDPPAEPIVPAA